MSRIKTAVFPVGGLGTRFLPSTKSTPKEMLSVVDKPLIHHAFEEARDAGIERFIFITGRGKDTIFNHFDHNVELETILKAKGKDAALEAATAWLPKEGNVSFIRQQEPKGLGHAIWCARHLVGNEPFAVILPDDYILGETPAIKQLIDVAAKYDDRANVVATMEVDNSQTDKYGIVTPSKTFDTHVEIDSLVEKPAPSAAPSNMAVIGRYVLQPEIFAILENQSTGAGGEIQITDAINSSVANQPVVGCLFDGERYDCGDKAGFVKANIAYALQRADLADDVRSFINDIASGAALKQVA